MAHRMIKALPAIVAALVTGIAGAQPALPTPAGMPAFDASGLEGAPTADSGAVSILPAPTEGEVVAPGQATEGPATAPGYRPLLPYALDQVDALGLPELGPAITESSGTWLRRGLWYADLDAVVMQRTWNSLDRPMIEEFDFIETQTAQTATVQNLGNVARNQITGLGESSPGYDGSARLALGRFLFRDQRNRDHTTEMVVFGGAELSESVAAVAQLTGPGEGLAFLGGAPDDFGVGAASGIDARGLQVTPGFDNSQPTSIDFVNSFQSFDGARSMQIGYSSRFDSWEWNYSVAQRMRKDRMELAPSGEWVRRASPGITWDYTAGLRYFRVKESLAWLAQDIRSAEDLPVAPSVTFPNITGIQDAFMGVNPITGETYVVDADGRYDISTSNDLFGMQLGAGMTYETDRWNVTVSTKHGFYINDARGEEHLAYTDAAPGVIGFTTDLHENGVSYLAQGAVTARYHLRPNLSLRAGWEFMYLTGLALAPSQVDFNPGQAQLALTGDVFYHGVTFGTEYYW